MKTQPEILGYAEAEAQVRDRKNLAAIAKANKDGRIDAATADYMAQVYGDGMKWFRQLFQFLGDVLGAPKTPVISFDPSTGETGKNSISISEIGPTGAYMVHHRFDMDPMRNQFFTSDGSDIDLSVSSIITVIVGAQKSITRALDKIQIYYDQFVSDVINTADRIITAHANAASAYAICTKIKKRFGEKFITNASKEVIAIIGRGHEDISVELVRALDLISTPSSRLCDIYRIKCLFDMVPQARAFIEKIQRNMPDKVLNVKDCFYNLDNSRNYRDAKIILNIGDGDFVVPLEIICQIRKFYDAEQVSHKGYEQIRAKKTPTKTALDQASYLHQDGINEYNAMVLDCLKALMDRIGWNILYTKKDHHGEFEGFPEIVVSNYPQKIIDEILRKTDNNVRNEIFKLMGAPREISREEEINIFRYMACFVMASALPYSWKFTKMPGDGMESKLFNFVMSELYRYYKNDVL